VSAAHASDPSIRLSERNTRVTIQHGLTDEILAEAKEAVGDGAGVRFTLQRMSAEDIAKVCEAFPAMSGLDIERPEDLTSIPFVAKLTNLTRLEMSAPVADLSPLSNLTGLNILDVRGVLAPDLKWMSNLTNLTTLIVMGVRGDVPTLVSLEGIPSAPNLTRASFLYGALADLTPLLALSGVTRLNLEQNIIADLTPLAGLPAMEELILSQTTVTDFSPLAGAPALKTLDARIVREADFSTLGKLTRLETLEVGATYVRNQDVFRLKDISWISGMTGLKNLQVDFDTVADFSPLRTLPQLERLRIWRMQSPVDLNQLSGITSLKRLTLQDNNAGTSGFGALASLVNLEELTLIEMTEDNSSTVDMAFIAFLENLKKLTISSSEITGGFDAIANCVNLEEVVIRNPTGTVNFAALMTLPNLRSVTVPPDTFTEEQVAAFASPNVRISQSR